jgi:DNA polymerase-3 subunit delta'
MAGVWDELLGQPEAIEQLSRVVTGKDDGFQHSWLFTGPAGSGRSTIAKAFAASLQCENRGCGSCQQCSLVLAGAHPDVRVLATDKVIISIDEVRELVQFASMASSVGDYRVVVIEDADRMSERTSNVLLKALEEPQDKTIWMLCAPSAADLLPTIRSRTRNVSLRLPSNQEVAQLLVQRDGVTEELAIQSARQAQQHVGMARRLAVSQDARARRQETMRELASITNLSGAMAAAEHLLSVAKRDAEAVSLERDKQEKEKLLAAYGLGPQDQVPPGIRSHIKELEDNQKRRNTRALRDGIDRVFTDAESFIRDVLSIQLGTYSDLINQDLLEVLNQRALLTGAQQSVEILDAIKQARVRLESNVRDLLVLEALCTTLIMRRQVAA